MHKRLVIDFETLAKEFEMDASPLTIQAGSFPSYKKGLAIDMPFPYQTPWDVSRKLMITNLSPEDRILHFVICKVLFPQATNFTQITNDELFYM